MWKYIPNTGDQYQVSDSGEVKSCERHGYNGRTVHEKILKPSTSGSGYLTVCLRVDGKTHRRYIHRLVAECFVENDSNFTIVNHIDGNKRNNNSNNLEWTTYSDNNTHAYRTGLKASGSEFYNSKLSEDDVKEILICGKYGTYQSIADKYGVSKATIRDIFVGRTWKSLSTISSNDYPEGYTLGETPCVEVPHLSKRG